MASEAVWIIIFFIFLFIILGIAVYLNHTGAPASSLYWLFGVVIFIIIIFALLYAFWPRKPPMPPVIVPGPPVPIPVASPASPSNTNVFVTPPDTPQGPMTSTGPTVHNHFYGSEQPGPSIVAGALPVAPLPVAAAPVGGNKFTGYPPGTQFAQHTIKTPGTWDEDPYTQQVVVPGGAYRAVGPNGVPGTVRQGPRIINQQVDRPPVPISSQEERMLQHGSVVSANGQRFQLVGLQ